MASEELPTFNMDNSETGCCPPFDPSGWEGGEFEFHHRAFVVSKTINFMHIPLNIGSVIKKTWKKILAADAAPEDYYLILSTDSSPWRGEHYFAVTKDVPDLQNATLSGRYLTKVFEGPFRDAGKWVKETQEFVAASGQELKRLYFFYTTCPKCAKHYGKNYVVAFAEV